jgi:hypothetical protein
MIGGLENDRENATNDVWILDWSAKSWKKMPSMRTPRFRIKLKLT